MKMTSQKIILIVEDNEINRIMLRGILEPQYKVLEAQNGLEALKVLGDQKDNVSLILLDIMMPVMDGYTFLSILKNDPSIASIPVIGGDAERQRIRRGCGAFPRRDGFCRQTVPAADYPAPRRQYY